jgi:lipoprotein NlpI
MTPRLPDISSKRVRVKAGLLIVATGWLTAGVAMAAESVKDGNLLTQARAAYAGGKPEDAIKLATEAIKAEPADPRGYFVRARIYEESHQPTKALTDYDQVLKLDSRLADAWQHRGVVHFKLGQINESIADFDQFIALRPDQAPYQWQRGIACYYAERFEDGRKQFELHRSVNPDDVENAAWHFLCVARSAGIEAARKSLIPIKNDTRVPMMEIHALFAGKAKPEDVLNAARAGTLPKGQLKQALYYAHLYVGLYFEATGDKATARTHIMKAANEYASGDFMGDVARIHLRVREHSPAEPHSKN